MKLNDTHFKTTTLGAVQEQSFEIDGESPVIFEILRDKMYSNKIGAVCREVASNSRDANRESGKEDTPVKIQIIQPNSYLSISDMSIMFEDRGPGITPDRMSSIYLKYSASTKRDSNEQTGGFGLGAKTPFAYSDTFTVITVCDWEGKRMKYEYSAMIDTTRKGKMVLFDSEETDEPCGTRVIVPIAQEDRLKFEYECLKATAFWNVMPEFIGFSSDPLKFDRRPLGKSGAELLSGDLSSIGANRDGATVSIDGIPYPINLDALGLSVGIEGTAILVHAPVGALTISANREQVQYDDRTVEYLKDRVEQAAQHLVEHAEQMVKEEIEKKRNLLEAQIAFNKINEEYLSPDDPYYALSQMRKSVRRLTGKNLKMSWNGEKLVQRSSLGLSHWKVEVAEYQKYEYKWLYHQSTGIPFNRYIYHTSPNGEAEKNIKVYIRDTRKTSRRNISAWDGNDPTKKIMLLTPGIAEVDEVRYKNDAAYAKLWDAQLLELEKIMRYVDIEGFYSQLEMRDSDGTPVQSSSKVPYHKRTEIDVKIKQWNTKGSFRAELVSATIKYDKKAKTLQLTPAITYLVKRVEKLTGYYEYTNYGSYCPKGGAEDDSSSITSVLKKQYPDMKGVEVIVVADRQWKYFEGHPQVEMFDDVIGKIVKKETKKLMKLKEDYIKFCVWNRVYVSYNDKINKLFIEEEPRLKKYVSNLKRADIQSFETILSRRPNQELRMQVNQEIDDREKEIQLIVRKLKKQYEPIIILTQNLSDNNIDKMISYIKQIFNQIKDNQTNCVAKNRPHRRGRACVSKKNLRRA